MFEEVPSRRPELGIGMRRTLERRIHAWRAVSGPEQDVIFRRTRKRGRSGLFDFADMAELGVTVAGVAPSAPAHCSNCLCNREPSVD